MTYEKACELLGLRATNDRVTNRNLAHGIRQTLASNAPLRFKVACHKVIDGPRQQAEARAFVKAAALGLDGNLFDE
jgi:hypothetical protein